MIKRIIGVVWLMCIACVGVHAQSTTSLRINEVLPYNVKNYVDAFGNRGAWIEIYNASAGSVEMAGCYITNDLSNPKKYMISKGDISTKIRPHQRILLWADNMPHHGALHTNFTLDSIGENIIALFDASGKKLIDQLTMPVMGADCSFGARIDGDTVRVVLASSTPSAANFVENGNPAVEKFIEKDPFGIGMSITAMFVVFVALILLYLIFKQIGKIALAFINRRKNSMVGVAGADTEGESGEVLAAIAMAIYENQEGDHDYEETVLTINRVTRNYSPWSSKIYGLRDMPNKK